VHCVDLSWDMPSVYVVKPGDCVSAIIARETGQPWTSLIEEFKRLNPDVTDINLLYPGQKLLLPVVAQVGTIADTPDPNEKKRVERGKAETIAPVCPGDRMTRVVSYFDNWSQYHTATIAGESGRFTPENIDGSCVTNIIYAFASISPDFKLQTIEWNDELMYKQVMEKKKQYPHLKVSIAVGGWNFNQRPETKHIFSDMVSTRENRAQFIQSSIDFAHKYGFDGIDIDWEYPACASQGGRPQDTENFTRFLMEFRSSIDDDSHETKLLLTVASPAGESTMKLIQFDKIHQYVDWFNLMAYDYHGGWDRFTAPHTALCSADRCNIQNTLDLYIRAGVPPNKIVVGVALYGRTWTLKDPTIIEYGAPVVGPGKAGIITQHTGVLNQMEIYNLIGSNWKVDERTQTVIGWAGDQFVTFDNQETLDVKIAFFHERGLGGVMTWAMSLDHNYSLLKHIYAKVKK